MSDTNPTTVQGPPPSPQPPKEESDPRKDLHDLATQLMRQSNRRLLIEYLRLRRSLR